MFNHHLYVTFEFIFEICYSYCFPINAFIIFDIFFKLSILIYKLPNSIKVGLRLFLPQG